MNASSREEAQQRADDIRTFRKELARLDAERVLQLDPAQTNALDAHHRALLARFAGDFDVDSDARAKQLSLGMRIASFIGAIALATSVYFLFDRFWGYFSPTAQVLILVPTALAALLATAWVRSRDATGYFTKLAALVAFACFVLNITMLGQIFNITPSDKALLPWAALAFLLAYSFDLRLLLAAGILCVLAFVAARVGTWSGIYWIDFGERPENFFPAAFLVFGVPLAFDHRRWPAFPALYRIFGMLALFLPILVLANWAGASYLRLDDGLVKGIYQTLGFVGTAAFIAWGTRRHWSDVVNTGVALFVVFFYSKLFDWWWDEMPKYLFFLLMALAAILLLLVFQRLRKVTP